MGGGVWCKGCEAHRKQSSLAGLYWGVIVMYATTALDRLSGSAGGHPQAGAGRGGTGSLPVPGPRRPVDEVTERLEHRPEAAGAARHTAQQILDSWHVGRDTADAAVLVVSELVTNAVEHAEPPLILHLHREHTGDHLWVEVTDGGPAVHHGSWTTSCSDDEHGRGLAIVDTIAETHGTRALPDGGATHWARLKTT